MQEARRGISLFFVLSSLGIISVFALSMYLLTIESMQRNRRLVDDQGAAFLAQAAIACAAGRIIEAIENPDSAIYKTFTQDELAAGTILQIDTTLLASLAEKYRDGGVTVKAQLVSVAPLDPVRLGQTSGGMDLAERCCMISFEAEATVGGLQTYVKEVRELRVVHLMPSILGKFTFFVGTVPANPDVYNQYANSIFGYPDDRILPADRYLPIVFKNGGELDEGSSEKTDPESFRRRGYVYLGGGRVNLNLTSGEDVAFGESFHFSHIDSKSVATGYFHPTPPDFFCKSGNFTTPRHSQALNNGEPFLPDFGYAIRFLISGFFTTDKNGNGMNVNDQLGVTFKGPPVSSDPRMRSSILHLYGNRSNPSPTLVLGEIYRRYVEFGGIVVEVTGDAERDGLVTMLPEIESGMQSLPPVPAKIPTKGRGIPPGTEILLDPAEISFTKMFQNDLAYKESMCKPKLEAYLRSHDFLYFSSAESFEPSTSLFSDIGKQAQHQKTFTIAFHPDLNRSAPFFKEGALDGLPKDLLAAKAVYRLPNFDMLKKRFYDKTGRLALDAVVLVQGEKGKTFPLPPNLVFERGGIIILEKGSLLISGCQRGKDPDQNLTLAALDGNIELDLSRGGPIDARLVALNGKITNLTPSRMLDLNGGMNVGQYLFETFPNGGKIAYDSISDPTGRTWPLFYRAFVADVPAEIRLK